MFRKIIHIVIALLLITSTTGFSISKHYCGDNLVSISVNTEAESCCGMDSDCCHNETEFFQLDNDYDAFAIIEINPAASIDILFPITFVNLLGNTDIQFNDKVEVPESPPPKTRQIVLISLQSFLC